MKTIKLISLSAIVLSATAVAWTAQPTITGGGLIIGGDGAHLATLSLQCHDCTEETFAASGHFNYVDHQTGAHMNGPLSAHVACEAGPNGRYVTDCILFCDASLLPGAHVVLGNDEEGGTLAACIRDNGQGNTPPDEAVVVIRPAGEGFRRISGAVQGNFHVNDGD